MKLPKIIGDTWFNLPSDKQALISADFADKIVLVDFWTYSCINCLRTLPYLQDWWEKYKDKNFLLIGIHTPEFEFEKNTENVKKAIKDLGVDWPVVLDNDYLNWNNFANHYWPAKYLADRKGNIVYEHFGEGEYTKTEQKIVELLANGNLRQMPKVENVEHHHGAFCFSSKSQGSAKQVLIPTPETYCGFTRGKLANSQGFRENEVFEYKLPENLSDNEIALSGSFLATEEFVQSSKIGASLYLSFKATEVNLILASADKEAVIEVKLNDELPELEIRGTNVDKLGEVKITQPTMYNLIKSKDLVTGILKITSLKGRFQAYAFTFSGCTD